jgi:hypothetical protein
MLHVVGPGAGRHVICYWPHRLAWAGRSLIVSTVDWDLLLFENIATTVGAAAS